MDTFLQEQQRLLDRIAPTRRYLYRRIDWNLRCVGILGARGTGKTTLMLQRLRERYGDSGKALYISVDSPYFQAHDLHRFAGDFHQLGGEALFIDEIHKYPEWATHIKAIHDGLPDLQVVFSGSSMLQISRQKADLSRRAVVYNLHGLSLREYINFVLGTEFPPQTLEAVLETHRELAAEICRKGKVLALFRDYLRNGYYPFFLEDVACYPIRVREVINHILEVDLPLVTGIEPRQVSKLKKLLYLLATGVPFTPNLSKLAEATSISRPKLYEYLERLQDGRLLHLVRSRGRGYEQLTKPERIYLDNANLMYAIAEQVNDGTLRELFFVSQLRNAHTLHPPLVDDTVELASQGDFLVLGRYAVEVGGRNKGFRQIRGLTDAFIAADGIETGLGNKIPLWLFGFLY